jgi:hypothetical protein
MPFTERWSRRRRARPQRQARPRSARAGFAPRGLHREGRGRFHAYGWGGTSPMLVMICSSMASDVPRRSFSLPMVYPSTSS